MIKLRDQKSKKRRNQKSTVCDTGKWHPTPLRNTRCSPTSERPVVLLAGWITMRILHPISDFQSVRPEDQRLLTPRHLLHEYLNEAIFRNRAQVLDDIAVLEVLVQGYFLMKRLGVPSRKNKASVTCQIPGAWGPHSITSTCPIVGHHFWKLSPLDPMILISFPLVN